MLFYGDADSPGLELFEKGLRSTLERELNTSIWIYDESFDQPWTGRDPSVANAMENLLRYKYGKRDIDVVVAIGEYPLQFMRERRERLLPQAKLMYVTWGRSPQPPIANAAGMVLHEDIVPTIEIALAQNPSTRHVLLIVGATEEDRALIQNLYPASVKYVRERHAGVDVEVLPPATFADSRRMLSTLPGDTVSIFCSYSSDSAGQGFVPARVLSNFSAITNRPMYGVADVFLGRGMIGGNLISFEASGAKFGASVVRVLQGDNPSSIPELTSPKAQNVFDWQQMHRWGISVDSVPPGSTVINREYTFWELYKWRLVILLTLIALEGLLIFRLIQLVREQKKHLKQLAYLRNVEELIAQSAAAFINLPPEFVNKEIGLSLQRLLEFFELDRISLFEFSGDTAQAILLCTRSSETAGRPPSSIDLHQLPWTANQIRSGKEIVVANVEDLPAEAENLQAALRAAGVRSFAAFPLAGHGPAFGALTFSTVRTSREWDPDLKRALRTIADIFSSALERKRAEEAALESRARLAGIVESAMDAVIAIDSQEHIVVFNTTAEKMFGCTAVEVMGRSIDRFIPARFRELHSEHVRRFAEAGETNRTMGMLGQFRGLRSNGEEFPIEASISRVKTASGSLFTVIVRDTTERERANRRLRDSHELNVSILQSLRNELAVLDSVGTIIAATARSADVDGASRFLHDLQVGANYVELCKAAVHRGDRDAATVLDGIQAVYQGRERCFEFEYECKKNADDRWFLLSVTPLQTEGGGVVISHEEITQRKRHEQAIQNLSGRLIRAQEEERSRIARELHDDINQQVAMLAIELKQLESALPESLGKDRQKVDGLWKKTHLLSTEIQQISHRLHSSKLEYLGVIAALRGLCEEFSAQHKTEVTFQFREVPSTLPAEVSLTLFRLAQESLHNIAKHSHARSAHLELFEAESQIVLRVSDDGVGFDVDKLKNASGLGLISMRERIGLIGGTLVVHSGPSLGTRVEATIPLTDATRPLPRGAAIASGRN